MHKNKLKRLRRNKPMYLKYYGISVGKVTNLKVTRKSSITLLEYSSFDTDLLDVLQVPSNIPQEWKTGDSDDK